MRRLTREGFTAGDFDRVRAVPLLTGTETLVELKALDSADVRSGRCPYCGYSPLTKTRDVTWCKACGTAWRIMDSHVYELLPTTTTMPGV